MKTLTFRARFCSLGTNSIVATVPPPVSAFRKNILKAVEVPTICEFEVSATH